MQSAFGVKMVRLKVQSLSSLLWGHDTFTQHHGSGYNPVLNLRSMSESFLLGQQRSGKSILILWTTCRCRYK